jgi:integrase
MMISAGENLGWVQRMMGHSSLKMITDKYFTYIPNMTHQDGTRFLEEYERMGNLAQIKPTLGK